MSNRVKWRSLFIGSFFALLFMALMFRVYWVQAVEAEELFGKAKEMWQQSRELLPSRGVVYDRKGNVLAQDAPAYTVSVNPKLIEEEQAKYDVIDVLAPELGLDHYEGRRKLEHLLERRNDNGELSVHREVHSEGWKIDFDVAKRIRDQVEQKQVPGVYLLEESKRYYPSGELAAHVLGYQDKEGNAVIGMEKYYDDLLRGTPGMIQYDSDLFGYETPDSKVVYEPAVDGHSLRLTLDANIQLFMEQAMEEVYYKYRPKSMTAIALEPQTMKVLGMANMPTFNPNRYWDVESYSQYYNHAISSQFEPGSTFKMITLAAAVEEGVFDPDETFMSGRVQVPGVPGGIRDHNNGQGWGEITYLDGLKRSSNVGFVKLGYELLGGDKLREYILDFGFGAKTGIDLPNEVEGRVQFHRPAEVATVSFGHGIAVTAIQQVAAVAAIANGGLWMQPYIVEEVIDSSTGEVIERYEPPPAKRVISEDTARKVSAYLETVISDGEIGTGHLAYMPQYRMAGKTGTAQIVVDGKYADDRWRISFAGYAPLEDPRIALLVVVEEPEMEGDYRNAGPIISPLFKEIMQNSLRYLGVASDVPAQTLEQSPPTATVPNVTDTTLAVADNELMKQQLQSEWIGTGNRVRKQFPEAGMTVMPGSTVYLLTSDADKAALPDLTGKSLKDALQICALVEVDCKAEGRGYVSRQEKGPNGTVQLELNPPNVRSETIEVLEEDDEAAGETDTIVDD